MFKRVGSLACAALIALSTTAIAKPKVTEKVKHYKISATTIEGLIKEMNRRGPNGYWAFTEWYVKWTGSCKVSVSVTYTMPKHSKPSSMPAPVRKKFDAMLAALTKHEYQHGKHGIMAAQEIDRAGCSNGDAILKKYNAEDIKYDKRTNHGKKEGATLK